MLWDISTKASIKYWLGAIIILGNAFRRYFTYLSETIERGGVNNVLFVFHTVAAHKSDCFNEKQQHSYLDSTLLNTMFGSIFSLPL